MTTNTEIKQTLEQLDRIVRTHDIDPLDCTDASDLAFSVRFHLEHAMQYRTEDPETAEWHMDMAVDHLAQLIREVE